VTPRERAEALRLALRAREIALDAAAVTAIERTILEDRAERDAVRGSAAAAYERALAERDAGEAARAEARHRELLRELGEARERADMLMAERNAEAAEVMRLGAVIDDEAERTAQAVREAYQDAAQIADRYGHAHIADLILARATSPAPEPVEAAERAVVEAAEAWRACLSAKRATGSVLCPPGKSCGAALEAAVDALAAARQDGAR